MFKIKRLILGGITLVFLCFAMTIFSGNLFASEEDDYMNLEIFTDVLSLIRSSYVENVDMDELVYGAIRGMLNTLDPHSSFLTPEMYKEMQADTHGEFGGLGIEITIKDGELIIVSPIEDTPAYAAGVKAGDQIVKIDGKATRDIDFMEAVRLLRGPKGEAVTISIHRSDEDKLREFTIIRDIIQVQSVKSNFLQGHFGYVRVSQFQDRTGTDLKEHLQSLRQDNGDQLRGMILDLRNNPGGLLDQAVAVSDLFLSEGLIVYTEGREAEAQLTFSAQPVGTEPDYPLIVMINGGSASAAEIVAGALQDHQRAIILGEQSFGKGSVQTVIPLDDHSGLRLTTARYFTPSGRSIQARGIHPDIIVPPSIAMAQEKSVTPLREQDLANHFQSLVENPTVVEPGESQGLTREEKGDNQLLRALDLLKGINLFKGEKQAA
ncbi:MAG: S41 family peptidase [Thermodesulfobacteriota bacterium]|nr:S41 family peptidase [Thermodesulfobacteriota bacterium]